MSGHCYVFVIGSLKKGGAERNVARVASELCEMNHKVFLILFERLVDYPLHERVIIIDLNLKQYKNRFQKLIKLYFNLTRSIWKINPDYAIAFTRLSGQFLVTTMFPRLIVRYDTYPFFFKKRKWITSLVLFNMPNVKKIICPSLELKNRLQRYFLKPSKLQLVYNPVAQINAIDLHHVSSDLNYFIIVGRLRTQKEIHIAIEAFAKSNAVNDFELLVLGEGPEEARLKALTAQLGLLDKVHFKGFVSDPYPLMRASRGLILSSNKEGFPNVVVEALSLGVPVLASDCLTGPNEIIIDGINGYLFPVGDTKRLSELIDALAYNEAIYRSIKQRTKDSVSKFSNDIIFNRWQEVLNLE